MRTGTAQPIHQAPYAGSWKSRENIRQKLHDMLKVGVIENSKSPWSASVTLVKKRDGTWWFCVDYRRLNAVTEMDCYPLPRMEDALSLLAGTRYFSPLDLQSGYWQVPMHPEDRVKTAFITPDGVEVPVPVWISVGRK